VLGATGLHNVKKLHGVTTFCQIAPWRCLS